MSIGLTSEQRVAVNHEVHQNQRERLYQDLRQRVRFNVERLHELIMETDDVQDWSGEIAEIVSRIRALHFVSQKVAARLGLNLLQISEPETERRIAEVMDLAVDEVA